MKEQDMLLVGVVGLAGGILHVAATHISSQCQQVVNFGRCVEILTSSPYANGFRPSIVMQSPCFLTGFIGAPLGYAALSSITNICNTLCEPQISVAQKIKHTALNSIAAAVSGYLAFQMFR